MTAIAFREMFEKELETLPASRAGEVLDFIRFLKTHSEPELILDREDQEELNAVMAEDDWVPLEDVKKELL